MCMMTSADSLVSVVTTGNVMTMEELANVKGRGWEDIDVSSYSAYPSSFPQMLPLRFAENVTVYAG